jgi:hypothetical protein
MIESSRTWANVIHISTMTYECRNSVKRVPRAFRNYNFGHISSRKTDEWGILMNPPNEFDDVDPDRDELWNYNLPLDQTLKQDSILPGSHGERKAPESQPPWKRPQNSDESPQIASVEPPWKRSQGRKKFYDDAVIRSNNMSALTPIRLPEPPSPPSNLKFRVAITLAGVAMAAGILGYEFIPGSPSSLPPSAPSSKFDQSAISVETISTAPPHAGSVNASQPRQPDRPTELKASSYRPDTSTIATTIVSGAMLMSYGEVVKARMIFRRVAEAGEGDGAFALAETYDPVVLDELRLLGEVMPDLAQAHTWYERATHLFLTDTGRKDAEPVLVARCATVTDYLSPLTADEEVQFSALLEKLMRPLAKDAYGVSHFCRLCEFSACPGDRCPMHADMDKWDPP